MKTRFFWDHQDVFNNYVSRHPLGDLLQTTFWGRLKQSSDWDYYPLAALKNGVIEGTALLLSKRISVLPACLFYSPRGPLFSSPQAFKALCTAGRKLAAEKGALVWKMDPAIAAKDPLWPQLALAQKLLPVSTGLDFSGVQPRFEMILDIKARPKQLLKNMKSKTRYNIRYSQRKEVRAFPVDRQEDLSIFYSLLEETSQRDGFMIRPFSYFQALWEHLIANNAAQLFLAYHQKTPLAGAIVFRLGTKVWYVYGASSYENRRLQAPHLIQWEIIKWAKGLGCHTYNFRGVSGDLNPDNPLYGLYRFKEGFGAELTEYVGEYDLALSRGGYALWRRALAAHNWLRTKQRRLI
ncbi:MAG: peptidoglycan bridge formation glycyltransferase FemA/FemB family protein [Firmicutes bacterium]|nr:peptidoglycan bridge formation glycyltransferase FemA/FemB family protein [Bacillota bacterium]